MFAEIIRTFFLISIAEMGDKTQIVAMTFATKYSIEEVFAGVFIGVFINHGLAIILGKYLSKLVPMGSIQLIAGIMFIIFGFGALGEEELDEEDSRRGAFGAIATVAMAFFLGELGDKTQLTAMTLSAESNYPIFILCGSLLGMLATSGMGIYVGGKIGRRVPDISLKIISSVVFLFFGTLKIYKWLPSESFTPVNIGIYLIVIIAVHLMLIRRLISNRRTITHSPIKEVANALYIKSRILREAIDDICLGETVCGGCTNKRCIIGYMRLLLEETGNNNQYYLKGKAEIPDCKIKKFNTHKVIEALSLIIAYYMKYGTVEDDEFIVNQIKDFLEIILIDERIIFDGNLNSYIGQIKTMNYAYGEELKNNIIEKMKS